MLRTCFIEWVLFHIIVASLLQLTIQLRRKGEPIFISLALITSSLIRFLLLLLTIIWETNVEGDHAWVIEAFVMVSHAIALWVVIHPDEQRKRPKRTGSFIALALISGLMVRLLLRG